MRNNQAGLQVSSSPFIRNACVAVALGLAIGAAASVQAQQGQAQQGQLAGPAASGQGEAPAERVNDFPTLARVEYVFECLAENPGPRHEMLYKCVCAVDRVAEVVSYDRWVDLSTFFKAQPMAGERGAYVRERADIQSQLKSYRELQARAKKACFIPSAK